MNAMATTFNDENFDKGSFYLPTYISTETNHNLYTIEEIDRDSESEHAKLLLANTKEMNADQACGASKSRVLAFKNKAPLPAEGYQNSLKILYSAQTVKKEAVKTMRHIPSAPVRILDAPDILDDYCEILLKL